MKHPHYQIKPSDFPKMEGAIGKVRNFKLNSDEMRKLSAAVAEASANNSNSPEIIEINSDVEEYRDEFLIVLNNPPEWKLSSIDRSIVAEKLEGRTNDPVRNNICYDLGFGNARNSKRHARYLGLTHSEEFSGTREPWAIDLFAAVTECIDKLFPDIAHEIYNDAERNKLWAGIINAKSRIEAMRLAETSLMAALLAYHGDWFNCGTPGYAWVMTISWWLMHATRKEPVRHAITTYGKDCANTHMVQRRKHEKTIKALMRLFECLPEKQKARDSTVFPTGNVERKAYSFAFLDKGIFYSLFASAIWCVFDCYKGLRNNYLMAAAFLVNVVMSESPDHFWRICNGLLVDERLVGGLSVKDCDPFAFGHSFALEIFKRKKGCNYPVHQRHIPNLYGSPPTLEQISRSMRACVILMQELYQLDDWNIAQTLHYYGKSTYYLVQECYGAGPLTAMHIIGVGACLKLFPISFLDAAEIGVSTRVWRFLKWGFGYQDCCAYEDMGVLLRAVAVTLDISMMQAEELCCVLYKTMCPSNADYDLERCKIDFLKDKMDVKGRNGRGDVIYRGMQLYRLNEKRALYRLSSSGVLTLAPDLVHEDLFKRVTYVPVDGFWNTKPKDGRKFHYKRSSKSLRIPSVKHYFMSVECSSEEDPDWDNNDSIDGNGSA